MSITLINASRRIAIINLAHDTYCKSLGSCVCSVQGPRRHARAVTIPAGESVADLDEAVLTLPDVIRAIRAGELRVRRQPPPPKPKTNSRKPKQSSRRKKTR